MKRQLTLALFGLLATIAQSGAAELSGSIMRPTPITTGVVAGDLLGGEGPKTAYVAVDLKRGTLMTQLRVAGRSNSDKKLTLELLNADARVAASAYLLAGLEAKGEVTHSFPVDSDGRYVIRIISEGRETGSYCVLMGGPALPATATEPACPVTAAAPVNVPPPTSAEPRPKPADPAPVTASSPAAKGLEVIVSKCEERLRVGADFLFDFDRSELRGEAAPTLNEIAGRLTAQRRPVMIEGHTDGKGSDGYNQTLSEKRALAVRASLTMRGIDLAQLNVRGFGKSRPVAPNQQPDGTDDPEGRQRNRRVEVVINTCGQP